MSRAANPSPSNHLSAFNAVMRPAAPLGTPRRITATERVENFIAACAHAVYLAFDDVDAADLTPGVDVELPAAVLNAYLLFLVSRPTMAGDEHFDAGDAADWFEAVSPQVWQLLGFSRTPSSLTVSLAFSLLGSPEHQAPELRALVWVVGDLAASNLMPGLRS